MRGKSSSDGIMANGGDKADMLNLLDSTDSDVEWLSLPPLKGKKPKKKKSIKAQKNAGCSMWNFMKIFLQLTVVGVIALLCVMCVWLTSQLNDVSQRLQQFESRSAVSIGDLEKLYQQMTAVNRSLEQHSKTFGILVANISSINNTVTQLSSRVDHVTEGLKLAPELKLLPEKLQAVSQSVATLGADVSGLKETLEKVSPYMKSSSDRLDNLTKQIQEVSTKVSESTSSLENPNINPELANEMQKLLQQISDVNTTVATQISALIKSNSHHEERILQLENVTSQLVKNISSISTERTSISSDYTSVTDDYTSEKFTTSVTNIVHGLLKSEGIPSSSDKVAEIMANITTVLDNLKEVESKYKAIEDQPQVDAQPEGKYVTVEMFQTLEDGLSTRVESLNSSFIKLKDDVTTMSDLLTKQANTVSNLTFQIEATKLFISSLQKKLDSSTGSVITTENITSKTTEKMVTVKPTTDKPEAVSASKEEKGSPVDDSGSSVTKAVIRVPWINNFDDLELNFVRWDRSGSGVVDPKILPDYLGPNMPSEEVLKPFDEDHNGLYSLKEFAKAFGFPIPSTTMPTTFIEADNKQR